MKVLHILPDTAIDPKQKFLGSTKDIRGRTEYFVERGIEFEEVIVPDRKDILLKEYLSETDLSDVQVVFIEFPVYPKSIKYINKYHPKILIVVRSHNAEFLHHLHYVVAGLKHKYWRRSLVSFISACKRIRQDISCYIKSNKVLAITEWEARHYWGFLGEKEKVLTLPYFIPAKYLADVAPNEKMNICVCLMSTVMNPFLVDAAKNFQKAVSGFEGANNWDFLITGDSNLLPEKLVPGIRLTGLLDSPFTVLSKSRAIAVLSDFGFGFKTKILDAVLNQCYVLVTEGLYKRLPIALKPFCFIVDLNKPETFRDALENCLKPFPVCDINSILRTQAYAALDDVFKK